MPKHGAGIDKDAENCLMLLQIDVADLMQTSGEGTVYFIIRKSDLATQSFDKVVAIYQQT